MDKSKEQNENLIKFHELTKRHYIANIL